MDTPAPRVVAIGECMLELSAAADAWRMGHAGDTFNTALYMARLGVPVAYLTALGRDPFSEEMRTSFRAEGVDDTLVLTDPKRLPGLYAIRTDANGERSFHYWRERSAARNLFALEGIESALSRAAECSLLYLSGITLSLFDAADRERLRGLAALVRGHGGRVAFDPNYRVAGWVDAQSARDAFSAFAPEVDTVLPTFDDERLLWGDADVDACIARWRGFGASEIVVKLGPEGCAIAEADGHRLVPGSRVERVVDTTGAGDSFNAAYLAARLRAEPQRPAAEAGNRLAAQVIQVRGAIMPR
jgi:2-dehydro-3-deoxygluconokinase